jgi:23S rRNA-/tRNA-specific pseudouridylate synthase
MPRTSPSKPRKLRATVLYEDEDLLVIDKPPVATKLPSDDPEIPCALDLLKAPPTDALWVAWGLADEASGIVIYARSVTAQADIQSQAKEGLLERRVLVLVDGFVARDAGTIEVPLRFDARQKRQKVSRSKGYPALTRYTVQERLAGNTLLACEPVTDHTDQVRVHLRSIGHPLTVDPLYGGGSVVMLSRYKADYRPNFRKPERPLIERLSEHAARVAFTHPRTGVLLTLEAPPPKDFRAVVTQLGRLA